MRFSSIITLVCAIGALVLSCLCLFAGNKPGFLQNGDLLTLNLSKLGQVSSDGADTGSSFLDGLINDAGGSLSGLINGATSDIADALNIPEYFNVHVLTVCEANSDDVTTKCSSSAAGSHFDISGLLEAALPSGITLQDIHWPEEVTNAEKAVRIAFTVAIALYAVAIAFSALALIGAIAGFFTNGRLSACCNVLIDLVGLVAIAGASALATVVINKAASAVNKYGSDIGISADKGDTFMGMTWAATGLMLIATIVSIVQLIHGRRNTGYVSEMKQRRHG